MNFDQLANLIKAGFNEEQIRSIGSIMDTGTNTNTSTNTPTPAPTTTALPTPTVTPAPTSAPETPPASAPATSGTLTSAAQSTTPPAESTDKAGESETVTLLKEMLGLIQKGNINSVGAVTMPDQTGADVLAEILNPTPKAK